MPAKRDLTGETFGRLFVLSEVNERRKSKIIWACVCECGSFRKVFGSALTSGNTLSCGCLKCDNNRGRATHRMSGSSIHNVWQTMKDRCHNPANKSFKNYGGRGILVCNRWRESFSAFAEDMGRRPKGLSLERKDNDKGYEPENCVWATTAEQSMNRQNTRWITMEGETRSVKGWAEASGISTAVIYSRLHRGCTDEDAVSSRHGKKKYLTLNGVEKSLNEWSLETGIHKSTILMRLKSGLSVDRALSKRKVA